MKKLALLLSVIVMVISSVMPVFAQPSVNVNGTVTVEKAEGNNGTKIQVVLGDLTEEEKNLVNGIIDKESLKKLLGADYSDDLQLVDAVNVKIVDENGNEIDGSKKTMVLPANITFNVPGATVGGNVKVLYYKDGQWHVADNVTVGDNTVAGVFDEASPFIFLVEGTPTMVSPKTGYNNVALYMAILAVASLTTIVVLRKKKIA